MEEDFNLKTKYIKIINEIGDEYGLDVATFGNQGLAGDDLFINNRFHNYSDGTQIQVDNVGDGEMFILRQSNNPNRRLDKPANYVGNGNFIQMQRAKDDGTGVMKSTEYLLDITNDGDFLWRKERSVLMTSTKTDDGTPAFKIQSQLKHSKVLELNYKYNTPLFEFKVINDTANLVGGSTLTNGMHIQNLTGPIQFTGGNGQVILNGSALVYKEGTYQTIATVKNGAPEYRPENPIVGEFFLNTYNKRPEWCVKRAILGVDGKVKVPAVWITSETNII